MQDLALLRTKLYRPRVAESLVPRPRLLERLNRQRERPLALVVAPAGYGKTTLLATWLEACDAPSAWLSLDEEDSDLAVFLSYLLAAVQTLYPDAGADTQVLLQAATPPPLSVLARSLINELDQIDQAFTLVLDDYHHIHGMGVHALLTELLRHPPRTLRLVLASRTEPPLSLTALRARSQMTEIRTQDLRFTDAEAATLLHNELGRMPGDAAVTALQERVEGWVTGLRLIALSSRYRVRGEVAPAHLRDGLPYVTDYLLTEVLEGQSPAFQQYLLRTSILDRFCAPLCEAVCPGTVQAASSRETEPREEMGECKVGGEAYLEWLEAGNLFVVPLDDGHKWYRYHHLFQQLLQHQLQRRCGPDEIAAIHSRASAWFAQHGLIDEALHHAFAARDVPAAARLLERNVRTLLNKDQWHTLENRLAQLPADVVQQRPELSMAKAWVSFHRFALRDIPPILETLETILDDDKNTQPLWGEVDFFWGHHFFWQGQRTRSLDLLRNALQRIPETHHLARGETELFWGVASQMSGHEAEAIGRLNQWLYYGQTGHPGRQTKLLGSLIFVYLLSGKLTQAAQAIQQVRDMAEKHDNAYVKAWVSYLGGLVHYCWNDLENAAHHFSELARQRYIVHRAAAIDGLAGLALTYQALGQPENGQATMALLHEFARETNDPASVTIAHSCQARLSLAQGDLMSAARWLQTADLTTGANIMFYWLEIPQLTQCRVLIADGSEASLQEATERLCKYRQENEDQHNARQLIDILLLQALANERQSKNDKALVALKRAVALAEPGGWIRPFVELGPTMANLLVHLSQQGVARDYVAQILAAFPESTTERAHADTRREPELPLSSTVPARAPSSSLVEPLTTREQEVLELLAQRLTNKEIAARLFISPGTVKQYTYHIYQKLGVKGRRQAVTKATRLDILSAR